VTTPSGLEIVASLVSLHVYPVKSCRGISLDEARVELRGLEHDRRWMIVDDAGVFVTQRTAPRLARVDVRLIGPPLARPEALVLAAHGHGEVRVPSVPPAHARRRQVKVWKSDLDAIDCGEEAARWITEWIGAPASLVFMPHDVERAASHERAWGMKPTDIVSFADGYPVLVATTASLGALNERLIADGGSTVPMDRFRANLVLDGSDPWVEDKWRRLLVGDLPLRVVKPCGRCAVTTTDQVTGERGTEPLRTLATFRQREREVHFAQNCVPDQPGAVRVGDAVRIVE
jgi:uncharacterized protein YcbX